MKRIVQRRISRTTLLPTAFVLPVAFVLLAMLMLPVAGAIAQSGTTGSDRPSEGLHASAEHRSSAGLHASDLFCNVVGPDSVFFDKVDYNRYLPGTFTVQITIINRGATAIDSVVAFPRSNQRFTIIPPAAKLVSNSMAPSETVYTDFALQVNPREVSGLDTIIIAVSGKDGARTQCHWVVWVEKEYRPVNEVICPSAGSVTTMFVDTLNDYDPNPIALPVSVINHGDAPSKDSRLFYVATPGVAPADGQNPIIELGDLASGERVDQVFMLRVLRRAKDTTVNLKFRVQGKGGLGDKIIDTLCTYKLFIPRAREVEFELDCDSDPHIRFEDGHYVPNPFEWNVTVKNTGNGKAVNVRAIIALPVAYILEAPSETEQLIGDMQAGEQRTVKWIVRARDVFIPDTSDICVRAFDRFNRMADCCQTLILPAVRAPDLTVSCTIQPDTVFVDSRTGLFQPSEFTVHVQLQNTGTDPADSVFAEIVISDPDIRFVSPEESRIFVTTRLLPPGTEEVSWILAPLPVPYARDLAYTVRITSSNQSTVSTSCSMHIQASLRPELACAAATTPDDTLHFNSSTLEYDPLYLSAEVTNIGSISVRDVQATILLPPNIGLAPGESAVKALDMPLESNQSRQVNWELLPVKQRDGSLSDIRVEFRSTSSPDIITHCSDWIFIIGIPHVTVFRIPRNVVERYGKTVTLPILIDESQNKDIRRIELAVDYEPDKVEFLGFDRTGTLLESGWMFTPSDIPGRLGFIAEHPSASLEGIGELVNMNFRVRFGLDEDILSISGTELRFDSLSSSVNNGTLLSRYYNGFIMVSGDCLWPAKASDDYVIAQNIPNPFNPSTTIRYRLLKSSLLRLSVHDLLGREVSLLEHGLKEPGEYQVSFDGRGLPSGLYIAIIRAGESSTTIKMILEK